MSQSKLLPIVCGLVIIVGILISNNMEESRKKVASNAPLTMTAGLQANAITSHESAYGGDVALEDIDKKILLLGEETIYEEPHSEEQAITPSTTSPVKNAQNAELRPYVSAESYLVANLETGEIYINQNSDRVYPIASISKLYTALVVHHLFDQNEPITITQSMLDAYGRAGNLSLGEKIMPDSLLYALLLESSNDAAEAYAQSYGYDAFIEHMNGFAAEIGMKNTSFKDASGLSAGNVSTAKDLLTLSKYLYENEDDILQVSSTKSKLIAADGEFLSHSFVNINPFSSRADFIGGKTGRTDMAKESMVSLFRQSVNGMTYPIAVIVLRSDFGERETNTEKLLKLFNDKIRGM